MKWKQILAVAAISSVSALGTVVAYSHFAGSNKIEIGTANDKIPANYAGFFEGKTNNPVDMVDLSKAANATVPAVVHIKTKIPARKITNQGIPNQGGGGMFDDMFNDFFMRPNIIPEQRASGSGVLVSEDGYIVTNNHVISDDNGGVADEINVTLHDRKTYKARVIGRDPASDIAVLKINGKDLPYLVYGNSDKIQLGQWVLAVGYPLTLETTVTAGIISATGRSIGINKRQTSDSPVESFIQTDAAVNQGNSGGALVDASGSLIGINSAILAPTGTYAGYSFAIPVNLVKKIVGDIIEFGDVQRGYLGISFASPDDLSEDEQKQLGLSSSQDGVLVMTVMQDGGAAAAGLKKGDVITKINNNNILTGAQLSAQLAGYRPGDKLNVSYVRSGKEYTVPVTLKKKSQVSPVASLDVLGGDLTTLSSTQAHRYGLNGGIMVNNVRSNGGLAKARVQPGFVITNIATPGGDMPVSSVDELNSALSKLTGKVKLQGIYPGNSEPTSYPLNLGD